MPWFGPRCIGISTHMVTSYLLSVNTNLFNDCLVLASYITKQSNSRLQCIVFQNQYYCRWYRHKRSSFPSRHECVDGVQRYSSTHSQPRPWIEVRGRHHPFHLYLNVKKKLVTLFISLPFQNIIKRIWTHFHIRILLIEHRITKINEFSIQGMIYPPKQAARLNHSANWAGGVLVVCQSIWLHV